MNSFWSSISVWVILLHINSKHTFLQPLPQLITPEVSKNSQLTDRFSMKLKRQYACNRQFRYISDVSFVTVRVAYASTYKTKVV